VDQRRGRAPPAEQEDEGLADIKNIMASIKTDGGGTAHSNAPAHVAGRPRSASAPAAGPGWGAAPATHHGHHAGVTLSDEELQQLKKITVEVKMQKDANLKKEAELREKEDALKRGTQLLIDQRTSLQAKEEALRKREGDLRNIATDLEKQAKRTAEREGQLSRQKDLLAEEEGRRKRFRDEYETKQREMIGREQGIRALENDLKLREQHLLGFEQDIKECPYCNVKFEMEGVRELLDEISGFGIDLAVLEKKYDDAMSHIKREAYDMALDSARGLLRELKNIREDVLAKGIKYVVAASGRTVASAKQDGMDTAEAENLLGQAKKALEKEDYQVAEHFAKEAEYIARDLMRQQSEQVQPEGAVAEEPEPARPEDEQPAPEQYQEPAPEVEEQQYPSMYPPPQEEAPPEEAAPPAPSTDKIYNCSSCYAAFKIGSSQRPVRVTCRSCGNGMIISD
jgi:hypothetical protein